MWSQPRRGPGDDPAVGIDDERLAGELELFLASDPVDEGGVVAVLEGGHLEFGFEDALGPLPHRPGLGHDDELGAGQAQAPHVFGEMTVVADGDADPAGRRRKDESLPVAGRVVAALVESGSLHDVDHAGDPDDAAVRVDDGRGIVGPVPVALEQIQDRDRPCFAGQGAE